MDPLANRSSSGLDYSTLLEKLLQQNGYSSDNSKHGLKSALKDYEAYFITVPRNGSILFGLRSA